MLNPKTKIQGSRIILTKAEKSFAMAQNHFMAFKESITELAPWLSWATPDYKVEDSYEYLLQCSQKWNKGEDYTYIISDNSTSFMGTISAANIHESDKTMEIGYWIATKYAGKGYMQEAVSLMEKEFFGQGINRIVIYTDVLNLKSANVAQKRGYVLEGISRQSNWDNAEQRYRDRNVFAKLKQEFKKEKQEA